MSCCTSNNFCMQMWPHQSAAHNAMGCPRVNAGKWHVVLRQLLHADVTSSNCCPRLRKQHHHTLPVDQAGCACQKPTVIKAAAGQHWFPCEFPCNARATHVQHTCNTTCNTSTFTVNLQVRLPFLVRLLQSFFFIVSIWKRRSACNGKKTQCYL